MMDVLQGFCDGPQQRMMVSCMVGNMTIEGRFAAQRVLDAVNQILNQPESLHMPIVELVRYCANELGVPAELPLSLIEEQRSNEQPDLWEDDWNEKSGVYVRTDEGLLPVRAL